MEPDPDDFGPIFVDPATVQSWLSPLSRKSAPETPAAPIEAAPPRLEPRGDEPPPPRRLDFRAGEPAALRRRLPWLRKSSILATVLLALAVWAASGLYKVQPDQVGLVLRFGRWIDTRQPGLNYHLPYPIEFVLLPKVTAINQLKIGNGTVMQMLTGDENIVEAQASISWRIKAPAKFLFNVFDPERTVRVVGESAVRQIIGLNPIQAGLSDQRQKIADDVQALLQRILDSYDVGIEVTQVQLQRVDPPLAVIDAFNDVQRARADQQRARNEAEAYRNDILPRARAEADRVKQETAVYQEQVLNKAHSDAERFTALDAAYRKSPDITASRLYLDTMDEVLKSASKILIDPSGHAGPSIIPYLSLGGPAAVAPVIAPTPKVKP